MAVIKFSIPDAWVDENNQVYGVVEEPGGAFERQETVRAMNESLKEWDFPGKIMWSSECRELWVEPETILKESWNTDFISSEPVNGWVHVLYANAEEL